MPANVILVIADDMSFDLIAQMPQLFKRLSANGTLFTRCFTATSICEASRATFITGQYSHNNGVTTNGVGYAALDQESCLPRRLQIAGYRTGHVGKYLNSWTAATPIPVGWNSFHGFSPQNFYNYQINDNGVVTNIGALPADYYTTRLTDRVVEFINTTTQPFYLQIGHKAPHFEGPLVTGGNPFVSTPHPNYLGCVNPARLFPRNPNFNAAGTGKPAYVNSLPTIDGPTINQIDGFWRGQIEMCFSMDRSIQAMMDALAATGKTNTTIIFTSDNGYMHGEFKISAQKMVPYEPSIRVPLIISGAQTNPNRTCHHIVSHVDIVPTIYAITGANPGGRTPDGVSLLPVMADPNGLVLRTGLMVEWLPAANPPRHHVLRQRIYKYIEYEASGEKELYDLAADPYEMTNLAGQFNYSVLQAELTAKLAALKTCVGPQCVV